MSFIDTTKYKWTETLKENWETIRDEYLQIKDITMDYPEQDLYNQGWEVFPFCFFGTEFKENQEKCPRTWDIVSQIPGLVNASFSILKHGTEIYPHTGFSNRVLRSHLALIAPTSACSITVGGEERCWKEGEMLIFDDTEWHSAFNKSEIDRVVLITDFHNH